MAIDPEDVKRRWEVIREKESLALDPESVSDYLRKPESEIVCERIQETLTQLALYRVQEDGFHSEKPDAPGDLATCEGLESFLIPAVEGVQTFSTFLKRYEDSQKKGDAFVAAFAGDCESLIAKWTSGVFSGKPYSDEMQIKKSLDPKLQLQNKTINITESAAMACRVLVHLLTLKLNRSDELGFQESIGKVLDDDKMLAALKNAIDFLIRAFQKGDGETLDARIADAKHDGNIGSGWSWTDWEGLPPMLFFTASAVDAFAELDLYLIRPAICDDWKRSSGDQKKLLSFYIQNEECLMSFQLCVEMARRWVQLEILPRLGKGYGLYEEEWKLDQDLGDYAIYMDELNRKRIERPPMALYNNLYGLQILLWSCGDLDDSGTKDEDATNRINRALAQLVYYYTKVPAIGEILSVFPHKFYLPGKKYFRLPTSANCEYFDSGFLPLLTRLLVLFVMYGVGDRNLLEPVIRNLYVDLLLDRNGGYIGYSALWSSDNIEMFSTQRAIQALTFYSAYARGKELVSRMERMSD